MARNTNYGVCERCAARVPARHVVRDGKVYLLKECPQCGRTEALVSGDAAVWQRKRELWRYSDDALAPCALECRTCKRHAPPRYMVFLDVTNRCNMNCPICVANVPGMGFEFHPPLAYFEKVFRGLGRLDPKPVVHLFGGEPTVREDLFEIVDLARREGLAVYLVTNGLKLADEDYCKAVCAREVPALVGFDGRDPAIYDKMRKNPGAYYKKVKALENLKKYSRRRSNVIMCCVARHINDGHIADLIEYCHEHRSHIRGLYFLPLAETWEPGRFEHDVTTTIEDVQEIVDRAFPDARVEFLPLGLQRRMSRILAFFGAGGRQTFQQVHPNCESGTFLISDGTRYRPLSDYLRRSLDKIADEAVRRAEGLDPLLARLDPRGPAQRALGKLLIVLAFAPLIGTSLDLRRIMKGAPGLRMARLLGGLLLGKTLRAQVRAHTTLRGALTILVLPFEETHSLETARLRMCGAGFAYEEPTTGEVKTIPACAWWLYNTDILRGIAAKYGGARPGRRPSLADQRSPVA